METSVEGGGDPWDMFAESVAPLVAEGQYYWANTPAVQALTGGPVHFALLAVGGVRADLPAGELREGDAALTLLPFKNQLSVLTLTGADVRSLLTETITATLPASAHELNAAVLAALDGTASPPAGALLRWYRGDDGALARRSTPP